MHSLLIINENRKERDYLTQLVNKQFPNFSLVLSTGSGYDGIYIHHVHKPEIVLLDIDLTSLNGFNVIKELKEKNKNVCIILITSNADIATARKAIQNHVHGFLLKPINEQELFQCISDYFIQLDHKLKEINEMSYSKFALIKSKIDNDLLFEIMVNGDEKKVKQFLEFYGFAYVDMTIAVMNQVPAYNQIKFFVDNLENCNLNIIHNSVANRYIFLILSNKHIEKELAHKIRRLINYINVNEYILGIGFIKHDIKDIHSSYLEALDEINQGCASRDITDNHLYTENNRIKLKKFYIKAYKNYVFEDLNMIQNGIEEITVAIQHLNDEEINEYLREFLHYHELQMKKRVDEYQLPIIPKIRVDRRNSYESLKLQLLDIYDYIMQPLREGRNRHSLQLVQRAERYIKKNHKRQLNLDNISEYLNVSSSYICRIFQEHTAMSITDYINECRIESSKSLLLKRSAIKDVAYEVGFRSATYFGRVFKRYVHMTPKEYMLKYKGANQIG